MVPINGPAMLLNSFNNIVGIKTIFFACGQSLEKYSISMLYSVVLIHYWDWNMNTAIYHPAKNNHIFIPVSKFSICFMISYVVKLTDTIGMARK